MLMHSNANFSDDENKFFLRFIVESLFSPCDERERKKFVYTIVMTERECRSISKVDEFLIRVKNYYSDHLKY